MVLIGSVKFDVNVKKILPFLLNAFTLLSDATNILSGGPPRNWTNQLLTILFI